jgi:hypothetical protein
LNELLVRQQEQHSSYDNEGDEEADGGATPATNGTYLQNPDPASYFQPPQVGFAETSLSGWTAGTANADDTSSIGSLDGSDGLLAALLSEKDKEIESMIRFTKEKEAKAKQEVEVATAGPGRGTKAAVLAGLICLMAMAYERERSERERRARGSEAGAKKVPEKRVRDPRSSDPTNSNSCALSARAVCSLPRAPASLTGTSPESSAPPSR